MAGLTRRQRDLLKYLTDYLADNDGVSPSFDEMQFALDLESKSGVHRLVVALERKGHIRRIPHSARSISIIHQLPGLPTDDDLNRIEINDLWRFADRVHAAIERREAAA